MSVAPDTGDRTYHHGDLKAALLAAARDIVQEEGADAFSEALRLQPDDVGTRRKLQIAREALGE